MVKDLLYLPYIRLQHFTIFTIYTLNIKYLSRFFFKFQHIFKFFKIFLWDSSRLLRFSFKISIYNRIPPLYLLDFRFSLNFSIYHMGSWRCWYDHDFIRDASIYLMGFSRFWYNFPTNRGKVESRKGWMPQRGNL